MSKNNSISYLLGNDPTEYRTCKECGMTFGIKKEEKKWFLDRGMALPKRCRDCRGYRRQQKIRKNIMGRSEDSLPTPFKLSSVDWINDEITRRFRHENEDELLHPETMTVERLVTAITYCRSFYNPFTEELMKRASNLEACGYISNSPKEKLEEVKRFFKIA